MSKARYKRIKNAIDHCDELVKREIKNEKKKAILDLINIMINIILILMAAAFSNIQGLLTTLGIGGLSFFSQWRSWNDTLKDYLLGDPKRLTGYIDKIRGEFKLCGENDNECLDRIEDLIRVFLDTMTTLGIEKE